jgi:hypothetical protein
MKDWRVLGVVAYALLMDLLLCASAALLVCVPLLLQKDAARQCAR